MILQQSFPAPPTFNHTHAPALSQWREASTGRITFFPPCAGGFFVLGRLARDRAHKKFYRPEVAAGDETAAKDTFASTRPGALAVSAILPFVAVAFNAATQRPP